MARKPKREERPKPAVRSIGYLLFALAWTIVFLGTTSLFVYCVSRIAIGAVGPFGGNPLGGTIVLIVLGAAPIAFLFFLSPFTSATQALIGYVLFARSLGGRDEDPPLAINTARRIPIYEPAERSPLTDRLVAAGLRARAPGGWMLAAVFSLGAVFLVIVFAVGWN